MMYCIHKARGGVLCHDVLGVFCSGCLLPPFLRSLQALWSAGGLAALLSLHFYDDLLYT